MPRLTESQWAAIRSEWESSIDEPSLLTAAERAGHRHGFQHPAKGSVSKRMAVDAAKGDPWERRSNLAAINASAHRIADGRALETKGDGVSSQKAQADRAESEDLRATVIARHRQEWLAVTALRDEAAGRRHDDLADAMAKAKFAKIMAETVKIQQEGERKAWGLDDLGDFDPSKLTDEQLEAIVRGRS